MFLVALLAAAASMAVVADGSGAQEPTITFAALGDFGADSANHTAVAEMIDGWNPDFIVTQGDNRYGEAEYDPVIGRRYCDYLTGVAPGPTCAGGNSAVNRFFPALGNHDYNDGNGLGDYLDYFSLPGNERHYDFVRGPVHFFVVDSGRWGSVDQAQADWLRTGLEASTAAWQIVTFHHAPYSSAQHGSNGNMQLDYAGWGADAVLAGHDHHYERIERDGIVYFVNGLGGRSIYGISTPIAGSRARYNGGYGAMRITAGPSELRFEFRAVDGGQGTIIDSHTVTNGGPSTTTTAPTTTTTAPPTGGGTVDVRVRAWDDDVEERLSDGFLYQPSSDLELVDDSSYQGPQQVGLRFRDVDIPAGATITAASLRFVADESDSVATDLRIRAHAVGDAGPFAGNGGVGGVPLTGAVAAWDAVPPWSRGGSYRSTDLSPVIQEVIDRGDWSRGNALTLVVTGTGERTAESYDGSRDQAPLLHIDYATGPPPTTTTTTSTTTTVPTTGATTTTTTTTSTTTVPTTTTTTTVPTTTTTVSTTTTTTAPPVQVIEVPIGAWDDDVEERLSDGFLYRPSSDLELVDDSSYQGLQLVGLRFGDVALPAGATITSASIRFVADESDSATTNLVIRANDTGNAARPSGTGGVSALPLTGASVSWNGVPSWSRGRSYWSPDLAPVIQELVDRGDWRSGNAMTMVLSGTGERTAESWDGDRASAPLLRVEFRTP